MSEVLTTGSAPAKDESASPIWLPWLYRAAGLAALALSAAGLYWSARLARADWLFLTGKSAAIQEAIRLAPGGNPEYYIGWAQVEPDRAVEISERGAALNPINSSLRIEVGLAAESKGDVRKAEASFIEAMRLDTSFAPRSVLSDLYFQLHDTEKFWPVAKAALAISYGDVADEFRKCWALSSDPQTILEKAMPDRPDVLRKYLNFLLNEQHLDAAGPVADRLLAHPDEASTEALLNYCDHLLAAGRDAQALAVWNSLSKDKLIAYPKLEAGAEGLPVNGDFRMPNLGMGFDWHVSAPDGIYMDQAGKPPALMLSFSGKQPESTEILSQYVPLLPGRDYVLSARYRVAGIGAESGLICLLMSAKGKDLLNGQGLLPGGEDGEMTHEIPFQTPDKITFARLVFAYRRMLGTMRIEGSLTLRKFSLTLAPEDGQ